MALIIVIASLIPLIIIIGLGMLAYTLITRSKQSSTYMENSKTKAIDIFLYLGIFISLSVSVGNFIQIIFAAIDQKFRDVATVGTYYDIYNDGVRMAVASLCVLFPLYMLFSWLVTRDIQKFLYKRDILVRKVMIYAALFVTLITLIGTLISVIYTYLGGEISSRFIWKAVTVFVIALIVFGYYYYNLKRDYTAKNIIPALFGVLTTVVVIASVVWSIRLIGTPAEMRAKRIDNTRLTHLSSIQSQIYNNFQTTGKIPTNLAELTNALSGFSVPIDPVTKETYEYKVTQQPVIKMNYTTNKKELATPAIFELCANFDTVRQFDANGMDVKPAPAGMGGGMTATDRMYSVSNYYYDYDQSPFWNHGVGKTCFKRIISADMYYGDGKF